MVQRKKWKRDRDTLAEHKLQVHASVLGKGYNRSELLLSVEHRTFFLFLALL